MAQRAGLCLAADLRRPTAVRPVLGRRVQHRDGPRRNPWPSATSRSAAMESFFSSLKTERTARKTYRTRDEAKADVFDYIERFYNAKRRHSTIGYRSPMEFEMQARLA